MNNKLDVVTLGEAMMMFVATQTGELHEVEQFVRRAAGAELNVAIGLSRVGLRSGWVSRIGNDSFGRFIQATLEKEHVDYECVLIDSEHATGFQLKSKAENGTDPNVEYFRKGSAASHLDLTDFNEDYFYGARHLHLSGVAAALSSTSYQLSLYAAKWMRNAGKTLSFDPNLRPSLWKNEAEMVTQLNQLAFHANWVLPGLKEGKILTAYDKPEDIADFYLSQGVEVVVIKTGEQGAYYKTSENQQGIVPALRVKHVIDTVGAGDGFAVGVISALLEGLPLHQAVERGNFIGARAIQVIGDSEGLPTKMQLQQEMLQPPASATASAV